MISLRQILVPTDFSPYSDPAIVMGAELVDRFGAELHLLHVREHLADLLPDFGIGIDLQPLREALKTNDEQEEIDTLARLSDVLDADWKQGKQITLATRAGKPYVEIVRYAREHDIDLIVIGTHGRSGLPHVLMGSVAQNVVRLAPCPVMSVRPSKQQFEMP